MLDEIESWNEKDAEERVINVDELAASVANMLDNPELLRRTRALVDRLGLQKWYPELG